MSQKVTFMLGDLLVHGVVADERALELGEALVTLGKEPKFELSDAEPTMLTRGRASKSETLGRLKPPSTTQASES